MPANTSRGYPYPLPTEPVAEGAQAIRNLAEAVDAKGGLVPLGEIDLLAATSFAAIPQTFDHLRLVVRGRSSWAGQPLDNMRLRVNDNASAAYHSTVLLGVNNAASSVASPGLTWAFAGSIAAAGGFVGHIGVSLLHIFDYKSASPVYLLGQSYTIGAAVAASMRVDHFGAGMPTGPVNKVSLHCENGVFAASGGVNPRAWLYGVVGLP